MWVNSPGIRGVSPEEEKECYCGKDVERICKKKDFKTGMKDWG